MPFLCAYMYLGPKDNNKMKLIIKLCVCVCVCVCEDTLFGDPSLADPRVSLRTRVDSPPPVAQCKTRRTGTGVGCPVPVRALAQLLSQFGTGPSVHSRRLLQGLALGQRSHHHRAESHPTLALGLDSSPKQGTPTHYFLFSIYPFTFIYFWIPSFLFSRLFLLDYTGWALVVFHREEK